MKDIPVDIIGGGASGMFLAYAMLKRGLRPRLLEASSRLGGVIESHKGYYGLYETAANSLISSSNLEKLCADIGVDLEPLECSKKYILRSGKVKGVPLGPRALLRAMWGYAFKRAPSEASYPKDLYSFVEYFLGREAAVYGADAMATGIYGCQASEIHVPLAFPSLMPDRGETLRSHMAQRKKLGRQSKRIIVYPKHGMGHLMSALERYLQEHLGAGLHLNSTVTKLAADRFSYVCLPAYLAAKLIPERRDQLAHVKYSALSSYGLCFERSQFPRSLVPRGLGCLIPTAEQNHTLGVLYSSSSFSSRIFSSSHVLLTCMTRLDCTYEQLMNDLRDIYQVRGEAIEVFRFAWKNAIPVYDRDLALMLESLRSQPLKHASVFANYTGEVSLRGILDEAHRIAQNH